MTTTDFLLFLLFYWVIFIGFCQLIIITMIIITVQMFLFRNPFVRMFYWSEQTGES